MDTTSILLDFPMLYDIDLSTIKYLLKLYPRSKYFNPYAKQWTDYYMKCLLVTRSVINPISILMKEEYLDQIDGLYKELKDRHWNEILKQSPKLEIVRIIASVYTNIGYSITVNCRNTLEQRFIQQANTEWKTEIDCDDVSPYQCLYIYDMNHSFSHIKSLDGKSIYVLHIKPNFYNFKECILKEIALLAARSNALNIISQYPNLKLPYDMTPDDMEVKFDGKKYSIHNK